MTNVVKAQRCWHELLASRPEDVPRAAIGTCEHFAHAFEVLAQNLVEVGYPIKPKRTACPQDFRAQLKKLERLMAVELPKALVSFWTNVGGVSLVDLQEYTHVEFWRRIGTHAEFCDGLHVDACTAEWIDERAEEFRSWRRSPEWREFQPTFSIALGPDCYHKDNISGGPPPGIFCDHPWAPTCNFGFLGVRGPESAFGTRADFLSYLRTAVLECAGFPALLGDPAFEEIRPKLLENVPLF